MVRSCPTAYAVTIAVMVAAGPAVAGPIVIDFEDLAPGTPINTQYAAQGVSLFSSPSGDPSIIGDSGWPPPVSGQGLLGFQAGGGIEEIRADFTIPTLSVSIDGGDNSSDDDDMFLIAYDQFDAVLDMDNLFLSGAVSGSLSVSSATPIAYVVFFSNSTINGSSIVWDNLTFVQVPAPGAPALLGLAGLASARRRQRPH